MVNLLRLYPLGCQIYWRTKDLASQVSDVKNTKLAHSVCLINTGWTNCWGSDGGRKHLFQNPAPPQEEQLMSSPGSRRLMRKGVVTMATAAPKINTLQSSHQLVCMWKRHVLADICRLHPGPQVKQQTKYWPCYHPACQNPILGNTTT